MIEYLTVPAFSSVLSRSLHPSCFFPPLSSPSCFLFYITYFQVEYNLVSLILEGEERSDIILILVTKILISCQQYWSHHFSYIAVRNQKGVSHPSSAEAPKCYVLHTPIPRVPVSEDLGACNLAADSSGLTGHEKDDNIDEDRVNIRVSSVPQPRAVISSPDNDTMIGNKNRIKGRERLSGSKNYGALQNRQAHCKFKSGNVTKNSPNMRKPKEAADKSSNATDSAKKSRRPTNSASSQITHPKKWEF